MNCLQRDVFFFFFFQNENGERRSRMAICIVYIELIVRALTRISKTGVQDSHLAKSRSSTGKSGSPILKSGSPTNSRFHSEW